MSALVSSAHAPLSRWAVIALLFFTAMAQMQVRYIGTAGDDWRDAINSDGKGYYEYVRMFLFPSPETHPGKGPVHPDIDSDVIKHFSGAAVCMAPFVLGAHTYTLFNVGKPEDGYSLHYQLAVGLAALCWLGLGLFALRRFLLECGSPDTPIAITLVLLTLGTGLVVQAVVHPAMSHVYGFAVIALLLLSTRLLLITPTPGSFIACAALLGLAVLIRPVNMLVVLALPMTAWNATVDSKAIKRSLFSPASLFSAIVFAAVVSVQGWLWYLQSGSFFVRAYPGEGFHWDRPEMLNSLFSARNGLLFYWPVLLLIAPGSWVLWQRDRRIAIAFCLFATVFTYVTSCWWNWAYGDNFGQRTYLDMLPVLAVPFIAAIPQMRWARFWSVAIGALLCALNLFQGWQYKHHLLITGQMDWTRYHYIFLRMEPRHVARVGGFAELPLFSPNGNEVLDVAWRSAHGTGAARPFYGLLAALPAASIGKPIHLLVDLQRKETTAGSSNSAVVRLMLRNHGVERIAHRFRMNTVPDAGPVRSWHYAFNMRQHEQGDTLLIKVDAGPGYTVSSMKAEIRVPR